MAGSYIPGAPSYVRQDKNGNAFALPSSNDGGHTSGQIYGGAPSNLRMGQDGQVHVIDTGYPQALESTTNKAAESKATVEKIAKDPDSVKTEIEPSPSGKESLTSSTVKKQEQEAQQEDDAKRIGEAGGYTGRAYAPSGKKANWAQGPTSRVINNTGTSTKSKWPQVATISNSVFSGDADKQTPSYSEVKVKRGENATVPASVKRYRVYESKYSTSWQNSGRKKEMQNKDRSLIQNENNYPKFVSTRSSDGMAMYDYRFIPGNGPSANIESLLSKVRMQYGIQVHGNPDLERNVLYYMYNRFKSPNWGLAHNRSFTHVFFTRPDCYLMESANQIADQLSKHSEMSMIYRRHPDLVRLLCDGTKMQDGHNFNLLLSNHCISFPMSSEGLSKLEVGKSWNDHKMVYGDGYTGRFAGEFSCTFNETADYSIINLIKLWITYIDNVSRGAMSPFYGHHTGDYSLEVPSSDLCHVHDKTLDYAASVYVFKVDPTGSDVLYWTKYYGVFPISTGADALSWEAGPDQGTPKLNITFAYSYKLDLNPISLLEFNFNSGISGNASWVPSYDPNLPGSARPLVGPPYIEFVDREPEIVAGTNHVYNTGKGELEEIKLRFKKDNSPVRRDDILFRYSGK